MQNGLKNVVLLTNGVLLCYKNIDMNFADKSMEFGNIIVSDDPDPKVHECYGLIYKMIWKSAT